MINLVFPGTGNLIASLKFMLRVGLIPHDKTSLHAFKAKDTLFVVDWLKSKGLHKLCSVAAAAATAAVAAAAAAVAVAVAVVVVVVVVVVTLFSEGNT